MIKLAMNLGLRQNILLTGRGERRGTARFPLQEEVNYKIINSSEKTCSGVGKTLNIGSRGILFSTQEKLPLGKTIELSVNWPARLGGTCALKFVAVGRVVRSEHEQAVVRIERYEFKTRRTSGLPATG